MIGSGNLQGPVFVTGGIIWGSTIRVWHRGVAQWEATVLTLGCLGKKLLVSVHQEKDCFRFGAVDGLIGWRLFYLSFAQASIEQAALKDGG